MKCCCTEPQRRRKILPSPRKSYRYTKITMRKHLNADAMFDTIRQDFTKIVDHRASNRKIPLVNVLMSAFTMFSLKDPSILAFDKRRCDNPETLHGVYGVGIIPCDSQIRTTLDNVFPGRLRQPFFTLFHHAQRSKALEKLVWQDGTTKQDCERKAAQRFLKDFRREHPHLKCVVIKDGLSSNGPHIKDLTKHNLRFILGANPRPCLLVEQLDQAVNDSDGKETHFSWVTNLTLTCENVYQIIRAGRAHWRIEDETFNTLKNQGYNLGHNYGLGNKHLSAVFVHLMMLFFGVDQIQQLSCPLSRPPGRNEAENKCFCTSLHHNVDGYCEFIFNILVLHCKQLTRRGFQLPGAK